MDATKRLREYCNQYKKTKENKASHKELAEQEALIWSTALVIHCGKPKRKGNWFAERFGGTCQEYEHRAALYNLKSQKLWDRIESGMAYASVMNISREARKLRDEQKLDIHQAIDMLLKKYDEADAVTLTSPNGRTFRRPLQKNKKQKVTEQTTEKQFSQEFARQIRKLTDEFASNTLEGVDEYHAMKTKQEFVDWVNAGIKDFLHKINNLKKDAKKQKLAKIGALKFSQACEILGINGKYGKPIDLLQVKKRTHERARRLHPDANNGNDAMIQEYQAVMEAREILESYMEHLQG